jgi:hypothetical protein
MIKYPDQHLFPPGMGRRMYYNPLLDFRTQTTKMTPQWIAAIEDGRYNDGSLEGSGPLNDPDMSHPYNLVSSLCTDGLHRPLFDLDEDAYRPGIADEIRKLCGGRSTVITLASSTPGHRHAYVPGSAYDWHNYQDLLKESVALGLITEPYRCASVRRGQTLLRPQHIRKSTYRDPEIPDPKVRMESA